MVAVCLPVKNALLYFSEIYPPWLKVIFSVILRVLRKESVCFTVHYVL